MVTIFSVGYFNGCFVVVGECRWWESDEPVVEVGIGGCICGFVWVSDMGEGCSVTKLLKGVIV